ncbi:hypothetical protein Tco_0917647, partial [Tanacetum coccineum]
GVAFNDRKFHQNSPEPSWFPHCHAEVDGPDWVAYFAGEPYQWCSGLFKLPLFQPLSFGNSFCADSSCLFKLLDVSAFTFALTVSTKVLLAGASLLVLCHLLVTSAMISIEFSLVPLELNPSSPSTVSSPRGVNPGLTPAMELMTPDLICPSTHQLLRSFGGDFGPDVSFDKSASLEYLFSFSPCQLGRSI